MFSLIITIISIALVAALALATIYYGGSAFTRGGDAAKASQLINEGQQLQGARTLAVADAEDHAALSDLTGGNYLAQVPAGWTMNNTDSRFESAAQTGAVCQAVNEKAGLKKEDTADTGDTDAALVVVAADLGGKVYGCISATNVVNYKF